MNTASPTILIIPGLDNSGPEHWQTYFERDLPNCVRVEQRDWTTPDCNDWVQRIEEYVRRYEHNVILVSHSCGSLAVAAWAARRYGTVLGAMVVAPTDVEVPDFPYRITGFAPISLDTFGFRALVIASRNDPYASYERSAYFAKCWGAELIDAGQAGHLNTASGHGKWAEGERIMKSLVDSVHQNAVAR